MLDKYLVLRAYTFYMLGHTWIYHRYTCKYLIYACVYIYRPPVCKMRIGRPIYCDARYITTRALEEAEKSTHP